MGKTARTKASSVLNVLGMTIAFAAFYVIMSQVIYDATYNRSIGDAANKYVVCTMLGDNEWTSRSPIQTTIKTADAIPGAELGFFSFAEDGNKVFGGKDGADMYQFGVHYFTLQAAGLLGFDFVAGNYPTADGDVAISDKVARTMSAAPGDVIYVFNDADMKKVPVTVTGVFRSFPANSDLDGCDVLWNQQTMIMNTADQNFNYNCVISFASNDGIETFLTLLRQNYYEAFKSLVEEYNRRTGSNYGEEFIQQNMHQYKLVSLADLHYSDVRADGKGRVSRSSVLGMLGLALLIVLIAFINFVNFFVALVPEKMRSVNIRKVFGASRASLIAEFIKEALMYVGAAIVLACVVILALYKSEFRELIESSIGIGQNMLTFGVLIMVSVVFAVLSALFPAIYVTRVDAAMGVRSGFSRSRAGIILRKTLITLQLSAAVAMMIIASVFYMQYSHMTSMQLGFDKNNLFVFDVPYYKPDVKAEIEAIPGVKALTASNNMVTGNAGMTHTLQRDDISFTLKVRQVLPNYIDVVGIPLVSGEGFTQNNAWSVIVDVAMNKLYSVEQIEEILAMQNDYKLAGFCIDTNIKPATDKRENGFEAYLNRGYDYENLFYLIVRTEPNADVPAVLSRVKQIIKEAYQLDVESSVWDIDDEMTSRYAHFMRQSLIIGLFSLIAIVIALMGVFGIVLFETEHRRHETAVRKVLGANGADIVKLFCKQYVGTVILACAIATPIALVVCQRYLEQFSSRVAFPWWVCMCVYLIIVALTLGIVAFQTVKASKENPVINLKSE